MRKNRPRTRGAGRRGELYCRSERADDLIPGVYDKQCAGKRKYIKRGNADKVAKRISRQQSDDSVNSYQCAYCGFYHVGHSSKENEYGQGRKGSDDFTVDQTDS